MVNFPRNFTASKTCENVLKRKVKRMKENGREDSCKKIAMVMAHLAERVLPTPEVLGLNPTTVGKINIEYLLAVNSNVKAKIMKNLLGIAYLKNKLKDTILIKLI